MNISIGYWLKNMETLLSDCSFKERWTISNEFFGMTLSQDFKNKVQLNMSDYKKFEQNPNGEELEKAL